LKVQNMPILFLEHAFSSAPLRKAAQARGEAAEWGGRLLDESAGPHFYRNPPAISEAQADKTQDGQWDNWRP
jgi:hypothetical protein